MLLFRRQLRGRIAELEKELSEMKKENARLKQCIQFDKDGTCPEFSRLHGIIATLKKENAELRVTNKGLASSVSELKAKLRAKKPGKETAR